jgi:hypothetical protein
VSVAQAKEKGGIKLKLADKEDHEYPRKMQYLVCSICEGALTR